MSECDVCRTELADGALTTPVQIVMDAEPSLSGDPRLRCATEHEWSFSVCASCRRGLEAWLFQADVSEAPTEPPPPSDEILAEPLLAVPEPPFDASRW